MVAFAERSDLNSRPLTGDLPNFRMNLMFSPKNAIMLKRLQRTNGEETGTNKHEAD
jgi:hypothetical protein